MSSSSYTEFNSSMFLSNSLNNDNILSTLILDKNQEKVQNMPKNFSDKTTFFFLNKKKYNDNLDYQTNCVLERKQKTKISESEFINNLHYCYDIFTTDRLVESSNRYFNLQFHINNGNFYDMANSEDAIALLLNDLASQHANNKNTLIDFNSKIHIGNYKDFIKEYIILYTNGTITSNVDIISYIGDVSNVFRGIAEPIDQKNIQRNNPLTTTGKVYKGVSDAEITQHPSKLKFNAYCVKNVFIKDSNYNAYLSPFDTSDTTENNVYTDKNDKNKGQRGCYKYSFFFKTDGDTLHELTESELETYLNRCEIYNTNSNCGGNLNCEYCKNIAYRDWYTQNNAKKIPILGNYADSKAEYNRTWIQTCNLGIGIFLLSIGIYYQQTN